MQDVKNFLTHLTVDARGVASTQNQAFNALLFPGRELHGRVELTISAGCVTHEKAL